VVAGHVHPPHAGLREVSGAAAADRSGDGEEKGYKPEQWAYIPARLDDNPYQDPEYEDTLAVLNKTRYEQLRHGDWTVFSGQFFSEWAPSVHVADAVVQ
jgi:hypothetical protein